VASEVEEIFKGIQELGPRNIKRVCELVGVPYAKGLACYKHVSENLRLKVCASANAESLGLITAFFTINPTQTFMPVALDSLKHLPSLLQLCLDITDGQTLFGTIYLPSNEAGYEYPSLFEKLKKEGFIENYSVSLFTQRLRYTVPMEYVDWETGELRFDWNKLVEKLPEDTVIGLLEENMADKTDLLLLKELEFDATRSFTELSRIIQRKHGAHIGVKKLLYHYTEHVVKRKLLSRYRVFLPLNQSLMIYMVANVAPANKPAYNHLVRSLPYLSAEYLNSSTTTHVSVYDVPVDDFPAFVRHFKEEISPYALRLKGYVGVHGLRHTYTIPFELYDEQFNRWDYDATRDAYIVMHQARRLLLNVKTNVKEVKSVIAHK
jgi:hypothetical protein